MAWITKEGRTVDEARDAAHDGERVIAAVADVLLAHERVG